MNPRWSLFLFLATQFFAFLQPLQAEEVETFSLPLRFSVIGDGVNQQTLELDYDLSSQSELRIGDSIINTKSFQVQVGTLDDISAIAAPYAGDSERRNVLLMLRWPLPLIPDGYVEAIGQSGRVLWQTEVLPADIKTWGDLTNQMRTRMKANMKPEDVDSNPIVASTWVFRDLLNRAPDFIATRENFRLCLARQNDQGQSRLCSPYMGIRQKNRKWVVEEVPEPLKPARVISFQKQSPLKARRKLKGKGSIQFLAELNNGFIYEFITRPPKVEIIEMVKGDKENIKVVGVGQPPAEPYRILNPIEESAIVRTFKWQETIGDFRQYWEVDVSKERRTFYFPGPSGGLFRQDFDIQRLPRESARPFIDYRTPQSTYSGAAKVYGARAKDTTVTSDQTSLSPLANKEEFLWLFRAQDRGTFNRSHVRVQDGDELFKTYFEMFKGYPRELSFRTTAIVGSGGNILASVEGAFNYWFEDLMGWSNARWSRLRWGTSAKIFQSLTPVKISSTSALMRNVTVDLKYRLRPGLWGRDETWGLILGVNDTSYDIFKAKMIGGGFFWARSMPRLFDDMFNIVPIMRYPKWVDLEFLYYPIPLVKTGATLNNLPTGAGNWALNFHGKVMWTKTFFGEAGFGVRDLDMNQEVSSTGNVRRLRLQFASLYTTVGLGYQF